MDQLLAHQSSGMHVHLVSGNYGETAVVEGNSPQFEHEKNMILVEKYRKFVRDLIEITDVQNYKNKKQLTEELLHSIENDCLDIDCVVKWLTGDCITRFCTRVISNLEKEDFFKTTPPDHKESTL